MTIPKINYLDFAYFIVDGEQIFIWGEDLEGHFKEIEEQLEAMKRRLVG